MVLHNLCPGALETYTHATTNRYRTPTMYRVYRVLHAQAIESTYSSTYDRVYLGSMSPSSASPLLLASTGGVVDVFWTRNTRWALVRAAFYRMLTLGEYN